MVSSWFMPVSLTVWHFAIMLLSFFLFFVSPIKPPPSHAHYRQKPFKFAHTRTLSLRIRATKTHNFRYFVSVTVLNVRSALVSTTKWRTKKQFFFRTFLDANFTNTLTTRGYKIIALDPNWINNGEAKKLRFQRANRKNIVFARLCLCTVFIASLKQREQAKAGRRVTLSPTPEISVQFFLHTFHEEKTHVRPLHRTTHGTYTHNTFSSAG